jgi:urease accessory protein
LTGDRILAADLSALAIDAEKSRSAVLEFGVDENAQTHIAKQFAPYPFHICRPFYVAGDPAGMATVYVQSCAGGIFEHDRLGLDVHTEQGARVHLTTSASTIVHSMPEGESRQTVNLVADGESFIEYLPDPMILFPNSRIKSCVDVVMHDTACVILSDAFLMHDHRDQGEAFDWFRSDIVVRNRNNEILVRDRIRIDGQSILAHIPGVSGRFTAQASFICLAREMSHEGLTLMRTALDAIGNIYAGVSLLPNGAGVFARILAADGVALRAAQLAVWSQARKYLTGSLPTPRRK